MMMNKKKQKSLSNHYSFHYFSSLFFLVASISIQSMNAFQIISSSSSSSFPTTRRVQSILTTSIQKRIKSRSTSCISSSSRKEIHTLHYVQPTSQVHTSSSFTAFHNKNIKTQRLFQLSSPFSSSSLHVTSETTVEEEYPEVEINEEFDYTHTRHQNTQQYYDDVVVDETNNDFFTKAERDANRINYPKGTPNGFYVTKTFTVPKEGFPDIANTNNKNNEEESPENNNKIIITQEEIDRLNISPNNITLPIALMLLDKESYPSFSRARKSCRKGYIVVNRGPLLKNEETGQYTEFDHKTCFRGRVIDRVFPGDIIGIQCRMHGGFYPGFETTKPPFELPVVYQDDHFAIINKPAGIVCYSQKNQNHGMMTVRAALPFALKPPKRGTLSIIRRPTSVHRLDKPTSGLLLVAKTKPAMVDLTRQFVDRDIKKTYTAILNGIPSEPKETSITAQQAMELGVDVDVDDDNNNTNWQLIDHTLDEKSAVTVWRPLKYVKSLKAKDGGILTLVEMKPKTGRYHQLRRHMSWVKDCPIIGDTIYDGGRDDAMSLRGRGLFLCSNKVTLDHPYYNTPDGRKEWDEMMMVNKQKFVKISSTDGAEAILREETDGKVKVHASIPLPNKFQSFLKKEEERQEKLGDEKVVS